MLKVIYEDTLPVRRIDVDSRTQFVTLTFTRLDPDDLIEIDCPGIGKSLNCVITLKEARDLAKALERMSFRK
jgi:hypothetical protein